LKKCFSLERARFVPKGAESELLLGQTYHPATQLYPS
jgi:hypothetical protein